MSKLRNSWGAKGIVILTGNDGVGKSTVTEELQEWEGFGDAHFLVVERSNSGRIDPELTSWMAKRTLEYTFEGGSGDSGDSSSGSGRPDLPTEFELEGESLPIYWMIMDGPVDVLESRLNTRAQRDIWETRRSLEYYRARYRELSGYYGLPLIDVTQPVEGVCRDIISLVAGFDGDYLSDRLYREVRAFALCSIDIQWVDSHDIEMIYYQNSVASSEGRNAQLIKWAAQMPPDNTIPMDLFDWLSKDETSHENMLMMNFKSQFRFHRKSGNVPSLDDPTLLDLAIELVAEGESKKVYRPLESLRKSNKWLRDVAIICLKPTIYSHSKQATGEIKGLERIRAQGTRMFLEMMYRNQLFHSYRSVNDAGIILSDFVDEVPPTEIVIKKYCEGTDKHSFYGMRSLRFGGSCLSTGEYVGGPYVRFDWRNPNHLDASGRNPNECPYYYLVESAVGKEEFFERFLTTVKPLGDKTVPPELVEQVIDTSATRRSAMQMFLTINQYFNEIGLEIQDCCFMLDRAGQLFWSEINQDCMRIKVVANSDSLDKDIWRSGGSSAKGKLVAKWTVFNDVLLEYFLKNRFHETEIHQFNSYMYQRQAERLLRDGRLSLLPAYRQMYREMARLMGTRRVIVTMDMHDGQPVLVKSGKVCTVHSDGSVEKALSHIGIFPDVLVVDLNGAFGEGSGSVNRSVIKSIAKSRYVHVGGGLRTLADVQEILSHSARRIVVGSNTDDGFIRAIPKERLIVELSVDSENMILTHGRKVESGVHIYQKMTELASLGVEAISVTFHQTEGHLKGIPRSQLGLLVLNAPVKIQKIIIAGGISSVDDLEFLWSFPRVIPQLGSAIWTGRLSVGEIYAAMMRYSKEEILPAIIQDHHGRIKGLVYLNEEAIRLTCDTRQLHRYSRQHGRVMLKGETSGDFQFVEQIAQDCDNDTLLITVDTSRGFCHSGNYSCFSLQTPIKANLSTLTQHIAGKIEGTSYSGKMQQNPGLALAKLMEEFWEIVTSNSDSKPIQVHECADLLIHLLMYLNGQNISLDSIMNELNARRWNPHLIQSGGSKVAGESGKGSDLVLAITTSKYEKKTDDFIRSMLGVELKRASGRGLGISYSIVNADLYRSHFGNRQVSFVAVKPKDMPWLIAMNRVDGCITYNTVIENFPKVYRLVCHAPDPDVRLCLIKRKSDAVSFGRSFLGDSKVKIACEHPVQVYEHLRRLGVSEDDFGLDHIMGSSESYLVNIPNKKYALCDAIVETGSTLVENDLEIFQTVLDHGQVQIGFYLHVSGDILKT